MGPGVPPSSCCSNVICTIISAVERPATLRKPAAKALRSSVWRPRRVWSMSQAKEPVKVRTQRVLEEGAPRRRKAMGLSVSCQVHQRNLAPMMS